MAFARALASGFDIDHMAPLVFFAECFTASRFMYVSAFWFFSLFKFEIKGMLQNSHKYALTYYRDACTRFVKIWKAKNDIEQWLETEGADSASGALDYTTMATAGIMLSGVAGNELNLVGPLPESAVESGDFFSV